MKKFVTYLLVLCFFMIGCGGRQAHPILSHQPNDQEKSCDVLRDEINYLNAQYKKKKEEHAGKEALDVALLIGGFFIIVPWFFMDLKDAEKVEYEAITHRIEHLTSLARTKNCEFLYITADEEE